MRFISFKISFLEVFFFIFWYFFSDHFFSNSLVCGYKVISCSCSLFLINWTQNYIFWLYALYLFFQKICWLWFKENMRATKFCLGYMHHTNIHDNLIFRSKPLLNIFVPTTYEESEGIFVLRVVFFSKQVLTFNKLFSTGFSFIIRKLLLFWAQILKHISTCDYFRKVMGVLKMPN